MQPPARILLYGVPVQPLVTTGSEITKVIMAVLVYCDMEVHADERSCGSSRGWMRVANLDMNNTRCNTCPFPLITISPPDNSTRRLCTRFENRAVLLFPTACKV